MLLIVCILFYGSYSEPLNVSKRPKDCIQSYLMVSFLRFILLTDTTTVLCLLLRQLKRRFHWLLFVLSRRYIYSNTFNTDFLVFCVDIKMERYTSSSSCSRILRTSSKNKENMNAGEKRTSSLQRRSSVVSILSSPSSIQKPTRGRPRNRPVMRDVIVTNKDNIGRTNNNGDMDVEIQENVSSSKQRQRTSTSRISLTQITNKDDESERGDDESLVDDQNSSITPKDSVWNYFIHIDSNTYQCRLCSNVCCFCLNFLAVFYLKRTS